MTLVADLKTFPDTVEPALPLQIQCLTLVQAHYPERMGRAVVGHAPAMFWLMWKAVTPFIDPVTKAKVAFCTTDAGVRDETAAHMGLDKLYETLGGCKPDHDLDVVEGEARLRKLEAERRAQLEATAREMGLWWRGPWPWRPRPLVLLLLLPPPLLLLLRLLLRRLSPKRPRRAC